MNKGIAVSNFAENLIPTLLGKLLPKRAKRIIFVSSFIAHIQNCQNPDKTLLNKLNLLLELSGDYNALDLPMRLHNKIWGNIEISKILEDKNISIFSSDQVVQVEFLTSQIRTVSEQIVKATPEWLRYDSNTKMRSDLIKLFKNLGDLLQKPLAI